MKKTKADEEMMKFIPEGWFNAWDLSPYLRNREYRCRRLEKIGVLKSRVVGEWPNLKREYKREN